MRAEKTRMQRPYPDRLSRRSLLKAGLATGLLWGIAPHLAGCSGSRFEAYADLVTLRQALDQGGLSARELWERCRSRIEDLNPRLGAVIEINPEAESLAEASGKFQGLLSGMPILLKDNMATADRQVTSAGSAALADSRYPSEAAVVDRLRQGGAVLAGKANMSEWSNLRSRNSTSGWSARGGQCRNPHDLQRSPSGSSSGSAAAVAAGMVPLALGTEMMGSTTCPASACGVVGLKPTLGLLPTDGIIPCAASFDCVGLLTRTVADTALALQAMLPKTDYSGRLRRGALKGARIGVARQEWGYDTRVDQVMETNLATLSRLGATLVDPIRVPSLRELGPDFATVWMTEFKQGVNRYLSQQAPEVKVRSLADVIAYNRSHPEQEALEDLGQELLLAAENSGPPAGPRYLEALERLTRASGREHLESVFRTHSLSAIVCPTLGPAWVIDFINGDHFEGSGCAPAALAGCPHLTVPGGQVRGLPVGFSFYGPAHSEASLLALAFDYEQETRFRVVPKDFP